MVLVQLHKQEITMGYILFDLDGTLLNTRDGIVTCIQKALASEGVMIDDLCLLERHIGPPLRREFTECYGFDDTIAEAVIAEFRTYYKEEGLSGTHPYEGIEECLKELKENGHHLIVATSKPEKVAREFLEHFLLDQYFEDICGSVDAGDEIRTTKGKVIEYALMHNNINDVAQVTMVGDRSHDVLGALEHTIKCVGVLYGFGSREELLEAGAIQVVSSTTELTEYFKKSI